MCEHSSASEIDIVGVGTIVGRSEGEIFSSGSENFHSESEIFCSGSKKSIVDILVAMPGDIIVSVGDKLADKLADHFYNRRAFFPQHFPTIILAKLGPILARFVEYFTRKWRS